MAPTARPITSVNIKASCFFAGDVGANSGLRCGRSVSSFRNRLDSKSSFFSRSRCPDLASSRACRIAPTRRSESVLKRLWLISNAFRRANNFRSSGSSVERGIKAPSTSTGITRIFRLRAVPISSRTKSSGLSSRRFPSSSDEVSQFFPITEINRSQDPTLFSIASKKSTPGAMLSTSMKIRFEGKWLLRPGPSAA